MAQNSDVLLMREGDQRQRYTRSDFTALRAWLNKLPIQRIADLYYTEDDLEALGCQDPCDLQSRLEEIRDTLVQRATDLNPYAAEGLRRARMARTWSRSAVDFLVQAAETDWSRPKRNDPVSAWFKPRVARLLKEEGAHTLADLAALINARGVGWWRPIPRIGERKARSILRWLHKFSAEFGILTFTERAGDPIVSRVEVRYQSGPLVPLERVSVPSELSGAQGINRNPSFALISARHDLEAIEAYLYKFRGQEKTERAYRKELERFLLWCVMERGKALSSVMQEDCEAFKDFIAKPPAHWIGKKTLRMSTQWKPFAGVPSPSSQRYAVQALRSFFQWLVNVRYLAGNPWITVGDPPVAKPITPIQIDKALPKELWEKLRSEDGLLAQLAAMPADILRTRYRLRGAAARISMPAQFRLVRAALMLMGDGGLRREEAAFATRDKLRPVPGTPGLWELDVQGKRFKWRTVFLPERAIEAIKAHWEDRGLDFSFGIAEIPLLSPLVTPGTRDAQRKHRTQLGERKESGFSQDGLYRVITTALHRVAEDGNLDLTEWERSHLRRIGPHAFRHTFGTQAAAGNVPLDVLQRVLGHASLQTTTIYVQAEKRRSIEELGRFFNK